MPERQASRFFVGREALLTHLHERLAAGGAAALHGLPGVGKTQTALAYAARHRADYRAVFWVRAATREDLVAGFGALAALLDLPEKAAVEQEISVAAARRWLERETGWLLIFDNADDLALAREFLPARSTGRLLLTTRDPATGALAEPLAVDCLPPEVGALFLLRRAGRLGPAEPLADAPPPDRDTAQTLAGELGGLPLALDQAGAYLEAMQVAVGEYLKRYREAGRALRARRGGLADHDSVAATFALAFAQVENSDPAAAELLRLCAFLDGGGIPEELFAGAADDLGPALAAPLGLDECCRAASRLSLLRRDRDHRLLLIHPVVQDALRDGLDDDSRAGWSARAVRLTNRAFPEVKFEHWPDCERLLPQALACAGWIARDASPTLDAALLLNRAGFYLHERARYGEAEPLHERALAIRERALGPDHPATAQSLNNLAELYRKRGRLAEAEPLFERALAIREQALGPAHPDTAESLNNLAALYRDQGRLAEAEPLLQRALAIFEKALGPDHPDTATDLNNLALLYRDQGRLAEAEPLYERALAIREQALGPDHPDTAQSLNNLALLYRAQDRLAEAEPLCERGLAIRERVLGPAHPDTALSLNNLAGLYRKRGRLAEAEPLFERALAIREQALGPAHPDTATGLNNLALLYRDRGRLAEAEPLLQRALAIVERALGPEHPHTRTVRANLGKLKKLVP
ncbi:MAG: tetratricopeptide repeat protein [Candidatus Competibacter sp.]